jgi:hypothetical protein
MHALDVAIASNQESPMKQRSSSSCSLLALVLSLALAACGTADPTSRNASSGGSGQGGGSAGSDPIGSGAASNAAAAGAGTDAGGSAGAGSGGTTGNPNALVLPIEVLGDGSPTAPLVVEARLRVEASALDSVSKLWLECQRCGFYGAPEYEATTAPPTTIKASLRLLGGSMDEDVAWLDVTDENVTLADDERVHGGINGGLFTTKITVELDEATRQRLVALPAVNTLQFRFNGTDGESNGFRVLNVELQNADADDVGADEREYVDPEVEKQAGAVLSDDVALGQALWYTQDSLAKSSIVDRTIHAACSSCHAPDGRDLQYFGYSNHSIVQRSRFHGLSEEQGRQIAAFLRYSLKEVPHAPLARPWNPPYQPGPGLDATPANWAAGAGLEAVLKTASDGLKALFGKDPSQPLAVTQADVDLVMDANATLNVREMSIPMQFPDWNAWLPAIHPMDVWPDDGAETGSFETGGVFGNGSKNPLAKYNELRDWLDDHQNPNGVFGDYSHLTPDERVQAQELFTMFGWEAYNWFGGGRGGHENPDASAPLYGAQVGANNLAALAASSTTDNGPAGAYSSEAFIERTTSSLMHWLSTQQWALAQEYGLEGNQTWFIGDKDELGAWHGRGEELGWPFNAPSVFYLAPHMLYQQEETEGGKREWYFGWESNLVASYYRTNQWYQLQMTINAGGQSGWSNYPMDWPYLTGFDDLIGQTVGSATPAHVQARDSHYVRLLQGRIKSAQYVNNAIVLDDENVNLIQNSGRYGRAQAVKHLAPANFMDLSANNHTPYLAFDEYQPGVQLLIANGAIAQFNDLFAATQAEDWRRCDPNDTQLGEPEPYAGFRYCLDETVAPLLMDDNGGYYVQPGATTTAQTNAYGLWKAQQQGAEATRVASWSEWVDRMW